MQKISDKELWALCQKCGAEIRKWNKKFAVLLPEVDKRKLYKKHGFYSIYDFAKRIAGLKEETVKEIFRTYKKVEDKPLLKAEIETQGWAKVRVAASIPVEEKQAVKMIQALPKSTLQTYAREIKSPTCKSRAGSDFQSITFKLDQETRFLLKKFQQKLEKEKREPVSMNQALKTLLKKTEKPKKQPRKDSTKQQTRYISVEERHQAHNNGKCAFPNCNQPHTNYHHPDRYAKTRNHKRIVPLCHEHHRLAHAGLIANEHAPPQHWYLRTQMQPNSVDRKYLQHVTFKEP